MYFQLRWCWSTASVKQLRMGQITVIRTYPISMILFDWSEIWQSSWETPIIPHSIFKICIEGTYRLNCWDQRNEFGSKKVDLLVEDNKQYHPSGEKKQKMTRIYWFKNKSQLWSFRDTPVNKRPNSLTPHEKFWSLSNKLTKIRDQDLVENLKTMLPESRKTWSSLHSMEWIFSCGMILYIYIYPFLKLPNDPIFLKGESLVFPKNTCHFSTLMRVGDECHP